MRGLTREDPPASWPRICCLTSLARSDIMFALAIRPRLLALASAGLAANLVPRMSLHPAALSKEIGGILCDDAPSPPLACS